MQPISLELIVKSKSYSLPFQFKGLFEIKTSIYYQLLVDPNHKYFVESNISEQNFQSFIDFLVNDKEPNITTYNYYDFLQLSQEFQYTKLEELIQSIKKNWNKFELNLYLLNDPKITDKFMIEQNVSENLDDYILNYSSQLMNVNIQSLLNIFRNPNKKFTEFNKAYNAIRQHFLLTNDDSIFILLQEIDGSKLNLLNLEDSILSASERFGFMPNKNLFCEISNLLETNKKQEEINQKMIDQIELINKEFGSYKEKNEEKFQNQERKYEEQIQLMNNELNICIKQLDSMKKEFDSYKNEKEIAFQFQEKKN